MGVCKVPNSSVLLLVLLLGGQAHAGAWVQNKNAYYLKFSSSYFSTTEEFDHLGRRRNILEERTAFHGASFRDVNLNIYLEYGWTERLTAVASLPFKGLNSERIVLYGGGLLEHKETRRTVGPGDLTLSLRHILRAEPAVFSAQVGIKLPLGYEMEPASGGPSLGTSKVDAEAHLLVGKSLHPLPFYFTAGLGYRRRGGMLNDEVAYTSEVGFTSGPALFKFNIHGIDNTSEPPDIAGQTVVTPLPGGGGVLPDLVIGDQNVLKLNPGLVYSLGNGLALQGDVFYVAAGKNSLSGTSYSLSLVLHGDAPKDVAREVLATRHQ